MSWDALSPELRALAEEVCTEKELEALKLKAAGMGTRQIGLVLDIDRKTAQDRLKRAYRKIRARADSRDAIA